MLKVLVADDEELARRRLRRMLAELDDVEIAGECETGVEVLRRLAQGPVDVLLLDIAMPGMTGLEAIQLLPEPRPHVVFCTAHAEHAVAAFEVGAVDYLLKPIEAARLARALERSRRNKADDLLRPRPGSQGGAQPSQIARLPITTRAGIVLVDPADVVSAAFDGELVKIRTTRGDYFSDDSLQTLGDRLPGTLERMHRRALVNLTHVTKLEPVETGGYLAHTVLGDRVEVSRQAARALRRRLGLRKSDDET
jgi:two-component system LytT family response regulator